MEGLLIAVLFVAVVTIGALAWWTHKRQELETRFGPEYEREVERAGGSKVKAARELDAREKRYEKMDIRTLDTNERSKFVDKWHSVQQRFVDDPSGAVSDGHTLVIDVMRARGYPVDHFEQRVQDISVDHAGVVDHYRSAHAIAERNEAGEASTEDLREAVVHYRALFRDLLETGEDTDRDHDEGRAKETGRWDNTRK